MAQDTATTITTNVDSDPSQPPAAKRIKLTEHRQIDDLFTNKNKSIYEQSKPKTISNPKFLPQTPALFSNDNSVKTNTNTTKTKNKNSIDHVKRILIQFTSRDGKKTGNTIDVPIGFTPDKLQLLINTLLNQTDDPKPYTFYYNHSINNTSSSSNKDNKDKDNSNDEKENNKQNNNKQDESNELITNVEIDTSLRKFIMHNNKEYIKKPSFHISCENVLSIIYEAQSMFRVLPIARCTSELPGHTEAILSVCFRCDNLQIASGSGDSTVRLWNVLSQCPSHILKGHKHWVLSVEYSPNGTFLASGDKLGNIIIWNVESGKKVNGYPINAHKKFVTSISWEPYHLNNGKCERLVTSGADGLAKIWNTRTKSVVFSLSGHTGSVKCAKWGGEGFVYTCSSDRTIRVWDTDKGTCVRILRGHAHWVNHIALSTEHALRMGPYDIHGEKAETEEECILAAKKRYLECCDCRGEIMVSASDDFTLFLWNPCHSDSPVARMTGHAQLVNHVLFSPDGRLIASGSFDKSVRVWDGLTGKFIARMTGHVQAVYRLAWSSDSRMIASASKDSTVKLWNLNKKKLIIDLPGHADEVYACDWASNGQYFVSGSKDRMLRIWSP